MSDHGKEQVLNFPFDWKESLYFYFIIFFFFRYSLYKKKKSEIVCPANSCKAYRGGARQVHE